jgi:predicted XRE-type DNA-binding protein
MEVKEIDIYKDAIIYERKLKLDLMKFINSVCKERELSQKEVGEILKMKQPRVSDLQNLNSVHFSITILHRISYVLGYREKQSERGLNLVRR